MRETYSLGSPSAEVAQGPSGWSVEKLATLVNVVYGKSPAEIEKLDDGIPIFGTGGIVGYTSETLCDGPSVILGRKGTIDKVQRSAGPFWSIDTTYYTTPKREFDWSWLYYAISSFDLRKLNEASGVPSLSRSSLEALDVATPPLPEQQKIAAILTSVDDKLDLIARQVEATYTLKRGLMQTLFSRGVGAQDTDGGWVPHTEFKDSELGKIPAGWAVKRLAAMTQESRARNAGTLDDALLCGVLKDRGLTPMRERVKGATTERCRIVEPNGFAYNPMRINIGSIARNHRDHAVMVSPDYVVFSTRAEELMYSYLDHFRRSDEWQRFVGRSGDGGVRIRIYYDDLAQLRMRVPPLKEQARIVEILDYVSEKVNNLIAKQREFQTLKRGLMQKLLTGEWRVMCECAKLLAA